MLVPQLQVWEDRQGFTPSELAKFYDVEYYTHANSTVAGKAPRIPDRVRTHSAWRFGKGCEFTPEEMGPSGSVVDIGCGGGHNMSMLKSAGFTVVGVEPGPSARKVAGQFGHVYSGTAESLPEQLHGNYDYALISHVLEHTISPAKALESAHGLLTRRGKVVIEVPNCEAYGFREFGPIWPWTDVPRRIHFFTQTSLTKLLEASGFQITKVFWTGFTRQFSSSWINEMEAINKATRGVKHSRLWFTKQSWGLLLRTAMASACYKYDSVRVHAIKI